MSSNRAEILERSPAEIASGDACATRPPDNFVAACQRVQSTARVWGNGFELSSIEKLARFVKDAELLCETVRLRTGGLTYADILKPQEDDPDGAG